MPITWTINAKLIVFLKSLKEGLNCDPRGLTFAYLNLHFINMINSKYCIWSICIYKNKTL